MTAWKAVLLECDGHTCHQKAKIYCDVDTFEKARKIVENHDWTIKMVGHTTRHYCPQCNGNTKEWR